MAEKSKKPAIRFAGFTDAWEQRKLGDIGSVAMCRRIFKHQTGESGDIPFFKIGTFGGTPDAFIPNELFENFKSKYPYPKKGDILISASGSIGRTVVFTGTKEYFQDSNIVWLKHDDSITNLFLRHLYLVVRWAGIEGSTIKRLYNDNILNTEILLPSVQEQVKIALILDQIDNLITLHQRKYDKLVNVKKAMLEKMFPKDGADVPEIRFKGFTEAWEQRKFFDCIERIIDFRGRTPKKLGMDWSESGYLALSAINVKDGYIDLTQDVHYGNQELYDKWMIGNELHKGQVLFTTEAPMGNVAQVPDNRQYILSQRTIAFNVRKGKIAENFLATILRSPSVSFALTSLASGGTAKGVSQSSLSKLDIIIPKNLDEQDSISNIFLEFTNLITLHQRKF